ncbi:DUF1178 family protein [Qipengyuania qiaonensis]|uniref:DUF1178 family protein n=1 Tax=Qipengyuania qiaonensis TaxID=2867240 RepID=A0ABS7J555_9SPHN|nr:DUF1178 family protein [Qipengyuania qiaonensis]MBX7481219.1 DUF1178 family protein [Qipengyuania qiaonensis]
MIVFDLSCSEGHRFEGWFDSSDDYTDQKARRLLACPQCGCEEIGKAPMAPSLAAKGNTRQGAAIETTQVAKGEMPAEVKKALETLAKAQAKALKSSTWVGDKFAEKAREMHYGEADEAPIHGRATRDEAEDMVAEGIAVAPLVVPVAPPDELN